MKILFRADASLQIGSGHVMRCLTLARAMRERGWRVEFAAREHSGNLIASIEESGFPVVVLPMGDASASGRLSHSHWLGATQEADADALLRTGKTWDWIIVDHYGLDREWENRVAKAARNLFVIDDLADRFHEANILLDQNHYEKGPARYSGKAPQTARLLLGPSYALLREEFIALRARASVRTGPIQRVLVFYGGVDPTDETGKALAALHGDKFSRLDVTVVVGGGNPQKAAIQEELQSHFSGRFRYLENISNMAEMMTWADLALGAGGTTTWERHCLGLPALVTAIAANQVEMSEDTAALGGQVYLGCAEAVSAAMIGEALSRLMDAPEKLALMSKSAMSVTDGFGTRRVLDVIC